MEGSAGRPQDEGGAQPGGFVDLAALGWDPFFDEAFGPHRAQGLVPGRVAVEYSQLYQVVTAQGEVLATLAGRVRHRAASREALPVVGDWVALRRGSGEGLARIQAVLPRKSKFSRKLAGNRAEEQVVAANVDTVLLVSGLDQDFNLRRIERYLVAAFESGARPVVVLNKADLCPDSEARAREVQAIAPGVPIHVVSTIQERGLDALRTYLAPGQTLALLGSSGVGKSTLVNRLVGCNVRQTQEVRASDSRGRHTTTHRELLLLPGGGLIIDTPGMRELQLWVGAEGYEETFEDVEVLAVSCHFPDCRHGQEPRCAVRAAIVDGRLAPERFANYLKLQKEQAHLERKLDERAEQASKRRTKVIHRAVRKHQPRR